MIVEIPAITVFLINLTCILFIFNQLQGAMSTDRNTRMRRIAVELDKIHETANNEVDPVSFDWYWNNVVGDVKQRVKTRHLRIPDELRHMARHVAVHARIDGKDRAYIGRVSRKHREVLTDAMDDHEQELDQQRATLTDYGINVAELEQHFSSK